MAKMWKNPCKNLSKSMLKICVRKSGKVNKVSFPQGFYKVLKIVFNKKIYLLNREVLHNFHRAYYYN